MSEAQPWLDYQPTPTPAQAANADQPWVAYGGRQQVDAQVAHGVWQAVDAAYQASTLGLIVRGKLPDIQPNPDAGMAASTAAELTSFASEIPAGTVGMLLGGAAGSEVPVVGNIVGAGAGMVALPMALRTALVDAYSMPNGPKSLSQILHIAKDTLVSGTTGAVAGGMMAATGGALSPEIMATRFGFGAENAISASRAARLIAVTGISTAASGHYIPQWSDFTNGALMLAGYDKPTSQEAATARLGTQEVLAQRLGNIYKQTGISPASVVDAAASDPQLLHELINSDDIPTRLVPVAKAQAVNSAVPDITPELKTAAADHYASLPEGFRPPVPLGLDAVTDPATLDVATKKLAAQFDEAVNKQTAPVSNAESDQRAINLLGSDIVSRVLNAPREPGSPTNAALVRATGAEAAAGLQDVNAFSADMLDRLDANEPVYAKEEAQYFSRLAKPLAILAEAAGEHGEAGRALQAAKALSGLRVKAETARAAIGQYEQDHDFKKLVRTMHDLDGYDEQIAAVKKMSTLGLLNTKTNDLWKAGLLGPHSWIAKGAGDATNLALTAIEKPLAATIGKLDPWAGNDKIFYRDVASFYGGAIRAVPSAFKIMFKAFKDPQGITTGFEPRDPSLWDTTFAPEWFAKEYSEFPTRIMGAATEFFKTLHEEGTRYELAMHRALTEGLQPGTVDFAERFNSLVETPTAAMAARIEQAGKEGTFTQDLTGKSGEFANWISKTPIVRWIFPFVRVPVNLEKGYLKHVPLIGNLMASSLADLKAGGARMHMQLARQLVGGVASYKVYQMFKNGQVTSGNLFSTPGEKNAEHNADRPLYSIEYDGKWYGYGRIPIVGPLMMTMADLADAHEHANDPLSKQTLAAMSTAVAMHAMSSMSYFTGIHTIFRMSDEPATIPSVATEEVGSFVPAMLRDMAAQDDPYQRRVDTVLDQVRLGLPGIREQLLPRINEETGQPQKSDQNISPFTSEPVNNDKLLNEMLRLGVGASEPPKHLRALKGTGKYGEIAVSPEDQNTFANASGLNFYKMGNQFVNSPGYDQLPEPIKIQELQRFMAVSRKIGSYTMPPAERQAMMEAAQQQFEKALQQK